MRIKVSMAGGVPICKIFWTSKRLSGCSSDFVGTKLPLNSDDFECCESSHQKQPQTVQTKICGLKIVPVKKSLTIAGIVNEMKPRFIVSEMQKQIADKGRKFGDFAVLYRTNAQSPGD